MKKNIFTLSIIALASLGLFSCGTDEQDALVSTVNVRARTAIQSEAASPGVVAGANLLNASIRIRDVAFIQPGNPITTNIIVGDGSPQEITLLQSGLPTSPSDLGSAVLNHGEYDRVTLRLDRGQTLPDADPMRNRSILISGTVNNMILNINTDVEEIITRTIAEGPLNVTSDKVVYLNINLNALFNEIDLRTAQDASGDNIISIDPSNIDDNRQIYNKMVENLPSAITVTRE